jgi:hypothetical protein
MARGGRTEAVEDDPTALADVEDPGAGASAGSGSKITPGDPAERSREPQTGL